VWLGAHIGTSDGLAEAVETGRSIGCECIQIFSKSPQSWKGPPILPENAARFQSTVKRERLRATAIHHCYLTNLASPKPAIHRASKAAFLDELERAEMLGVDAIIFHPGAHTGAGVDSGIRQIVESLDWALAQRPGSPVKVLLENAAGQGTTIGSKFEELAEVLERVSERDRVAAAIDTCHLFASGLDFRSPEAYGAVKDRIRDTIGLRKVRAFHLNDSKAECGARLDRHENIGRGMIGAAGFASWLNDPSWAHVPGYLETPISDEGYATYAEDLKTLRAVIGEKR
jgi:deoxyribonuclease IV